MREGRVGGRVVGVANHSVRQASGAAGSRESLDIVRHRAEDLLTEEAATAELRRIKAERENLNRTRAVAEQGIAQREALRQSQATVAEHIRRLRGALDAGTSPPSAPCRDLFPDEDGYGLVIHRDRQIDMRRDLSGGGSPCFPSGFSGAKRMTALLLSKTKARCVQVQRQRAGDDNPGFGKGQDPHASSTGPDVQARDALSRGSPDRFPQRKGVTRIVVSLPVRAISRPESFADFRRPIPLSPFRSGRCDSDRLRRGVGRSPCCP